jgi:site-specific DNA-methyltransferase (adenine-specific)
MNKLINGDCLEEMKNIPDGSCDAIICDPPYGTTSCKWDSIIDLELMWEQLKRIIKPNGAIVLTASQPFTTTLIASNMKMFKYCLIWEKSKATGFFHVKYRPQKIHEDIVIFSFGGCAVGSKNPMSYNPQGLLKLNTPKKRNKKSVSATISNIVKPSGFQEKTNYPKSILKFGSVGKTVHPTQKPLELMEYLIKTYTKEGETVLDFTMGSGTTGVAAKNLGRKFIGIELDPDYFKIAEDRIDAA